MRGPLPIPWLGMTLAFTAALVLYLYGMPLSLIVAILLVWVGTLWLAHARAPEPLDRPTNAAFDKRHLDELFELSGSPLLLMDRQKIMFANKEACRTLGDHIIGQDIRVAFRNPDAVRLLTSHKDGAEMVRGLVQRRDIWRIGRKRIDERLSVVEFLDRTAEADISRAHTDFVANASHELRTPLAAILGYVETLQDSDEALDQEMPQRFLARIEGEGRRLQSLVSDLMSLSRVEAEKHDRPETVVDLASLVRRVATETARPERTDRLSLSLVEQACVQGDAHQLEQLVRNLVDNAFKYGGANQTVSVELECDASNQFSLKVIDRGEGIAAEHLPHLTRRFYRTDPGRSRASGGTGLGLAIVKHIVERHRGRLDIESELGSGTIVTVRIPEAPLQEMPETPSHARPAPPSPGTATSENRNVEASVAKL